MKTLFTIACVIILFPLFAQEEKPEPNAVFLELDGPATYGHSTYGSINYEHKLNESKRHYTSGRIGLGLISFKDQDDKFNPAFTIPFGITTGYYLFRKNTWSMTLDGGGGLLFTSIMEPGKLFQPVRHNHLNLYLHGGLGINFPKQIMVRVAYTPILTYNAEWVNWGGVSIGYRFKR